MAETKESPYRKYQDAGDGMGGPPDGKHDRCAEVDPEVVDPDCFPEGNSEMITLDWRKLLKPYLNEKNLTYSITLTTKYDGPGGDALQERLNEYVEPGIMCLLKTYNKEETTENIDALKEVAIMADWHVGGDTLLPRPGAKMKCQLVVPAFVLDEMEDAKEEEDG